MNVVVDVRVAVATGTLQGGKDEVVEVPHTVGLQGIENPLRFPKAGDGADVDTAETVWRTRRCRRSWMGTRGNLIKIKKLKCNTRICGIAAWQARRFRPSGSAADARAAVAFGERAQVHGGLRDAGRAAAGHHRRGGGRQVAR